MRKAKRGFTLIELIIVIVILGILAVVALPKYFANIERARKAEALSTMRAIREGILGYYSAQGAYPGANTWPIVVNIGGDEIFNLGQPTSPYFTYSFTSAVVTATANASGGGSTTYTMCVGSGAVSP